MKIRNKKEAGFSMTELVAVTAIISLLSAIAIPNYKRSLCKTKQHEAIGEVSILKTAIMGYTDERGTTPNRWDQINEIIPVLTIDNDDRKSQASGDLEVDNPQKMRNKNYTIIAAADRTISNPKDDSDNSEVKADEEEDTPMSNSQTIHIMATPDQMCTNFEIRACVNTQTGVTDMEKGNGINQTNNQVLVSCNE